MSTLKFSVVIPYKQRLANLTQVLASLADQTMDASEFEVIVGALEYCPDYVTMCSGFTDRLTITSVLSAEEWNVSRARNLAVRQARGQVVLFIDADMVLPKGLLDTLYDRYYADGQNVCVLGQALGYSCVVGDVGATGLTMSSVDRVEAVPYGHYRDLIATLESIDGVWQDDRTVLDEAPLPWALCWSGLVALPTETIRRHDLTFDEGFRGWGSEDQEWGFRIHATGTPLVLGQDVYAMHLPHDRDTVASQESYRVNSHYFLAKWPCLEVEVSRAYGWEQGNRQFRAVAAEIAGIVSSPGHTLGIVRGTAGGDELLVVGAELDGDLRPADPELLAGFDEPVSVEILPLVGMALPYPDAGIGSCRILPGIYRLTEQYRDAVRAEAGRVAVAVTVPTAIGA